MYKYFDISRRRESQAACYIEVVSCTHDVKTMFSSLRRLKLGKNDIHGAFCVVIITNSTARLDLHVHVWHCMLLFDTS